jgi:hypothetical protein
MDDGEIIWLCPSCSEENEGDGVFVGTASLVGLETH